MTPGDTIILFARVVSLEPDSLAPIAPCKLRVGVQFIDDKNQPLSDSVHYFDSTEIEERTPPCPIAPPIPKPIPKPKPLNRPGPPPLRIGPPPMRMP